MKSRLYNAALQLIIISTLAGCVSVGTKVESEKLASFKKGETTYSQVVEALGAPQATTKQSDGKKILSYAYSKASPDAASFIPFFGALVGSTDAETTTVSFIFDAENKLESYSQSESSASHSITGTTYK
jgi:outer membrane protein assembly factor BamE (lipoprotein component of BamABCDE complex)